MVYGVYSLSSYSRFVVWFGKRAVFPSPYCYSHSAFVCQSSLSVYLILRVARVFVEPYNVQACISSSTPLGPLSADITDMMWVTLSPKRLDQFNS